MAEKKLTVRKIVVLAILFGADEKILEVSPDYILEKMAVPPVAEVLLDKRKREIFYKYAKKWKLDWDTERDLNIPIPIDFNIFGEPIKTENK